MISSRAKCRWFLFFAWIFVMYVLAINWSLWDATPRPISTNDHVSNALINLSYIIWSVLTIVSIIAMTIGQIAFIISIKDFLDLLQQKIFKEQN